MYETMMAEESVSEAASGQLPLIDAVPIGEEQVVAADTELFESLDVATDDEIAAAEAELERSPIESIPAEREAEV